ncbi:MAG: NAD(P)H-hydrate dehydratase [Candidatus Promineifilaceae bacterium]
MIKVFNVAEMVAAEKASDTAGNSYDEMMEKAGKAIADAAIDRYPITGRKVTILVGPGNNGGDGLVAGRYLAKAGADVSFYMYRARDPEEDQNLALVHEMNLPVILADFDQRYRALRARLNITDILIDGLLGTGVTRPVGGDLANLMKQVKSALAERLRRVDEQNRTRLVSVTQFASDSGLNAGIPTNSRSFRDNMAALAGRPIVIAVDCPSGLNCDSGALDPLSFDADVTVTFAGPKRGHFIFPGAGACGELVVADIDISLDLPEVEAVSVELATAEVAGNLLPDRPPDGHKGTFGWVLIAAGSSRYWGAAALAGRAAYRAGSGLVALAVPSLILPSLAAQLPEATYPMIADQSVLGKRAADEILGEIKVYRAILVGPGLHEAKAFVSHLLASRDSLPPLVIDADGLNILASMPGWPILLPSHTILTPHLGEMARLMGVGVAEIKTEDRVDLSKKAAREWDCVVLLKGAYTVIASPDGRCTILPFANPALATAGSGDVLSGIIVSLLGQGLSPYEAAILGGYLHGAAAQLAAVDAGLLAGEIADWVPEVRQALRD